MKNLKTFESFKEVNEDHDELNNYMFFQNLKTIKKCVDRLLELDAKAVDQLMNDHDWASDHISSSKDDLQEVCDWLRYEIDNYEGEEGEDDDEPEIEVDNIEIDQKMTMMTMMTMMKNLMMKNLMMKRKKKHRNLKNLNILTQKKKINKENPELTFWVFCETKLSFIYIKK